MWMEQVARNAIDDPCGYLRHICYVLHDRYIEQRSAIKR
jgi:hypothetical protein